MDVTPQVINEVEFHQKMRGYDPDEVDDFLERIAVAVADLDQRVLAAEARAGTAERHAVELEDELRQASERAANRGEDETETIKRTLILAQRTADAAVKEAQEEAQRTVAAAQEHADVLLSEAEATSRRMVSEAEVEARKASDDTRQRIAEEVIALEEARDALKADQGILERHLEEQRLRLRSSIGDLQRLLDDPARLRATGAPELSGATRPVFVDENATDTAPEATDDDDVIDLDAGGENGRDDRDVDVERPITGGVTFTPHDEGDNGTDTASGRTAVATDDDGDTDAWARFVREERLDQPTAALAVQPGDDSYLSELRKAMLDDTSGTSEMGERPARARFGRRR